MIMTDPTPAASQLIQAMLARRLLQAAGLAMPDLPQNAVLTSAMLAIRDAAAPQASLSDDLAALSLLAARWIADALTRHTPAASGLATRQAYAIALAGETGNAAAELAVNLLTALEQDKDQTS